MPKNNKNMNRWPKGWWNSISKSQLTSKHENAVPEGMKDASNERSREKEDNFYILNH